MRRVLRILKSWLSLASEFEGVRPLYAAIVAAARNPVSYKDWSVPDTLDGRFEMITLHLSLVLKRLGSDPYAQELVDLFILDMDNSLREMGAGDMGVGTRIKAMAQGFHGRLWAYDAALNEQNLKDTLRRNVYGTVRVVSDTDLESLEKYVTAQWVTLQQTSLANVHAGHIRAFP